MASRHWNKSFNCSLFNAGRVLRVDMLDLQSIFYITDLTALLMTCVLHVFESTFYLSETMANYFIFIVFGRKLSD